MQVVVEQDKVVISHSGRFLTVSADGDNLQINSGDRPKRKYTKRSPKWQMRVARANRGTTQ